MRYHARVIAMLIISALMVGGPALAGPMDHMMRVDCVEGWLAQDWGKAAIACDSAASDVAMDADARALRAGESATSEKAVVEGEGNTVIDVAYPAAFALARSAYAYYALRKYTSAEAQRQRAITLLSNAYVSPESSASYQNSAKDLLTALEDNSFYQNPSILN